MHVYLLPNFTMSGFAVMPECAHVRRVVRLNRFLPFSCWQPRHTWQYHLDIELDKRTLSYLPAMKAHLYPFISDIYDDRTK